MRVWATIELADPDGSPVLVGITGFDGREDVFRLYGQYGAMEDAGFVPDLTREQYVRTFRGPEVEEAQAAFGPIFGPFLQERAEQLSAGVFPRLRKAREREAARAEAEGEEERDR